VSEPRRCSATSKRTGRPCGQWAARGALVCKWHGANAPQVRAAADRRAVLAEVEAVARRVIDSPGAEGIGDPVIALSRLAGRLTAAADAIGALVNARDRIAAPGPGMGLAVHPEITVWLQVLGELRAVLSVLGRLNLDAHVIRVTEVQAAAVAGAFTVIEDEVTRRWGLDQARRAELHEIETAALAQLDADGGDAA